MTRLPALAPGTYNVRLVGTHVNGSTLQLTSQITIGGVGEFTKTALGIPTPAGHCKRLVRAQTKTRSDLHSQQTLHP